MESTTLPHDLVSLRKLAAPLFTGVLLLVACTPGGEAADDAVGAPTTDSVATSPETGSDTVDGARTSEELGGRTLATTLTKISAGYQASDGVWPGFVPAEHPVVLAWRVDGRTDALTINHPNPDAIGTAAAIDTTGLQLGTAHYITDLQPQAEEKLGALESFDFHMDIGGEDSYAMVAGGDDDFFEPGTDEYVATLLHEMFHRYQDGSFSPGAGSQDVEGYAYSAENLELATLEERALSVAVDAEDRSDIERAARHFAAIRMARLAADDRVVLDEDQEIMEGTARYLEHRIAGEGTDAAHTGDNYGDTLVTDVPSDEVKEHYGFGRFYSTGANVLRVLDLLDVKDKATEIESGVSPAKLLADTLGVTEADVADLVADARKQYDPLGELADAAAEAAEMSESEGPVFDDFGGDDLAGTEGSGGDGEIVDSQTVGGESVDGEGSPITDEELACLEENGFDLASPGQVEIDPAVAEECFA